MQKSKITLPERTGLHRHSNKIEKYYRAFGIFLVIMILAGGVAIIYKTQSLNVKSQSNINRAIETESSNSPSSNLNPPVTQVNINTADEKELDTLPGIGPVKAKAILDYRKKNGQFKAKRDIIKVKGIGEKTYEKLADKITVN